MSNVVRDGEMPNGSPLPIGEGVAVGCSALCRQCAAEQGRSSEWDSFHYGTNRRCDACDREGLCAMMPNAPVSGGDKPSARCDGWPLGQPVRKGHMDRYFVDERNGCIAVRDREQTDPDYPGLHPDTRGVVRYWIGSRIAETCPTCGQRRPAGWEIADSDRQAAVALCAELNQANAPVSGDKPSTQVAGSARGCHNCAGDVLLQMSCRHPSGFGSWQDLRGYLLDYNIIGNDDETCGLLEEAYNRWPNKMLSVPGERETRND